MRGRQRFRGHPEAFSSVCVCAWWKRTSGLKFKIRKERQQRVGLFYCVYSEICGCCECVCLSEGEHLCRSTWPGSHLNLVWHKGNGWPLKRAENQYTREVSAVFVASCPLLLQYHTSEAKMDEIHPLTKHIIIPLCIFNSTDPPIPQHQFIQAT